MVVGAVMEITFLLLLVDLEVVVVEVLMVQEVMVLGHLLPIQVLGEKEYKPR